MVLHSHIFLLSVFALCVSVVAAALLKDGVREQVRTGARIFGGLVVGAIALGWLLYFLPL
jgi:hypothetical protein